GGRPNIVEDIMPLYTELPETIDEVDVIIAGDTDTPYVPPDKGGTAGCVVAARLADADPKLSILVMEGGTNNQMPTIETPALFLSHLDPSSKTNLFYQTNKAPGAGDRKLIVATGGVLGGGSSINMLTYSRPQRSDWDSWNAPGWSADELTPYLKKHETYHGKDEKGVHGHDGPIHVSDGNYTSTRIRDEFAAAAEAMGWSNVDDLSDMDSINAVWRAKRFETPEGKRQDAATAVGVEFRPNPMFQAAGGSNKAGPLRSVKARKLVVASSGAINTPSLLERSGVGEPKVLERAGVPLVADLPGVGSGYEDHQLLGYPYLNNLSITDTLDGLVFGLMDQNEDLKKKKLEMLGWNGKEMQCKIRPTDAEVAALGPVFQTAWDREYKKFPADPRLAPKTPCLAVTAFTVYPFSRGHIHITGPKLDDPVDFESGFFADPSQLDLKKHMWLYKKQREVIRRMPAYRGELAGVKTPADEMVEFHPPFAADSPAALVKLGDDDAPIPRGAPAIQYSAQDDAVLEKWLRGHVGTTWHSLGTCKMLPREQGGRRRPGARRVWGPRAQDCRYEHCPAQRVGQHLRHGPHHRGEGRRSVHQGVGLECRLGFT
ncbi:alcohol oxidase, partial [Apiospora saccharicola]